MLVSPARTRAEPLPAWVGWAICGLLVVLSAFFRLGVAGRFPLPVGYGVPVVLLAVFRSRRVLWAGVLGFAILSAVKFFLLAPEVPSSVHLPPQEYDRIEGAMVLLDLFLVGAMVDLWIVSRSRLEGQNTDLEAANSDLSAREEEIARQNEELQSQTEELERQSEELRISNDDLAREERTLEILLSLSRGLSTQQSREEMLSRICETLGLLVQGADTASAILEQQGSRVVVQCHHGFGPEGLREDSIPVEQSFTSLVLSKGRTGYLEDIALRPDLRIPQPVSGAPLVAVLAAPLLVAGKPIGCIEVYSHQKRAWARETIDLVESLAGQTSVSLEAADLFERISRERGRFETVFRTVPVGVALCNASGNDVRFNPTGAAMLQLQPDVTMSLAEVRKAWTAFRGNRQVSPEEHPLARASLGEDVDGEELEILLPGGRRTTLLLNARPIRDLAGVVQGAVAAFADISAQKELQRELDARRREAEEASVRKTRFLAAVSHDIRTPANAISLLAELLRRTAGNPAMAAEIPELAAELHASAASLVNLLTDVLDLARFDSDKVELQETDFDAAGLLIEEQRQMLPLARAKGLTLDCNGSHQPVLLHADRIKLARIVENLVGNAIKFTESGGVKMAAHRDPEGSIRIEITDTGIGIPPEHIEHIFDEFVQLRNPERDRTKGSGLGLTICKRLVSAMGGTLAVRSTSSGSTFTVILPPAAVLPQKTGAVSPA